MHCATLSIPVAADLPTEAQACKLAELLMPEGARHSQKLSVLEMARAHMQTAEDFSCAEKLASKS